MAHVAVPREVRIRSDAYVGTGRPQFLEDLTLFTYPLLVDEGRLLEGAAELKAALEDEPFVEVNPADAEKLRLADGGRVRLTTEAGAAEVPVRVTPHVAAGAVFVPFNQPGLAANVLLSGRFSTGVTVEPAPSEPAPSEPAPSEPAQVSA
jgi:predicted molibdopterin-dependent oxidoreductase YjgC